MDIKRVASATVILPVVGIILIWGNKYIVDITFCFMAMMCLHEYFKAFRTSGKANPLEWIGYFAAALIAGIHIIPMETALFAIGAILPISILVLFTNVISTNLKVTINDIAITLFGIAYIVLFVMFLPIIREMQNGKFLIWYVMWAAWGTDVMAYVIGKNFGKHKYLKISPNKTVEGTIGGTIGGILACLLYTVVCNQLWHLGFNYFYVAIIGLILSIVGQIGDLAASSIKRYTGIKDFSNLIPGHGGMLDRFDSVIFIAPFAYFLLKLLILL